MAFDTFLKIEKGTIEVKGETQDKGFKDHFEIKSFSFGAENVINIGSQSGGGGAGKATFKPFSVTKNADTGSTGLFLACCSGEHFPDATLKLRRTGGAARYDKPEDAVFMKFEFKMLMVADIEWSGSDGDDIVEETVNFEYGAIKCYYYKQLKDGSHEAAGDSEWSRVLNKPILDT